MSVWDKKRDVMRRYDVTAQIYDMRYAEEQTVKIEAALKHVKAGADSVLDVGCGTGVLFSYVASKAETTVGLDISWKTLLKAKGRGKNYADVYLMRADADSMPFKSKVFGMVFAMTLIQNTPDPYRTLREIERVAKDSAAIVVTGLKRVFARAAFERLLRNAGLRIVAWEEENLKCYVAICKKALPSP
jgi:ubiquinone/menaquinone biosynthesis C-methylase UbiE